MGSCDTCSMSSRYVQAVISYSKYSEQEEQEVYLADKAARSPTRIVVAYSNTSGMNDADD